MLGSAAFERKERSRSTLGIGDWFFGLDVLSLLVTAPGLRQAVDRERRQKAKGRSEALLLWGPGTLSVVSLWLLDLQPKANPWTDRSWVGALFQEGLQEDDLDCSRKVGTRECVFLLTVSFQEPHVGSFHLPL